MLALPQSGVFCVADGMGGHDAGALASSIVVESLAEMVRAAGQGEFIAEFVQRLQSANRTIWDIAQERRAVIGSTVAALLMHDDDYACVWAGDSRVYRIRSGGIEQISRDHTEVQELVDQGVLTEAQARTWPRRNVITRAVGVFEEVDFDVVAGRMEAGDVFVICSDGLTAHLEDPEIAACVRARRPKAACDALIALTLERGATDNVTVIVVEPTNIAARPASGRSGAETVAS